MVCDEAGARTPRARCPCGIDRVPGAAAAGELGQVGGRRGQPDAAEVDAGRGVDALDVGELGQTRGVRGLHARAGVTRVRRDDLERVGLPLAEVGAQRVVDLADLVRWGEHPVVEVAQSQMEEGRRTKSEDHGARTDDDDDRAAHDAPCHLRPEPIGRRPHGAAPDREGVDARPDQRQRGGQHDQRRRARQQGHGDAGVGEGAQEHQGEDRERADRRGHGEGAARHGPPGVGQRLFQGVGHVAPRRQLFAETADDEEAVVDGEAEPEDGRQVHGEDGDRRDAVEHPQRQQGADDGDAADRQWHGRRDERAEDEEQQDERQRHRERLGAQEVVLHHAVDLVEGGGEPAHLDVIGPDACATAAAMAGSRRVIWSWSPTMRPTTSALVRLSVRSTGMESRLQYDCTFAMWGCAARRRVSARPAAATAGAVHRAVPSVDEEDEVVRSAVEPRRQDVGRLDRLLREASNPPWESREDDVAPEDGGDHDEEPGADEDGDPVGHDARGPGAAAHRSTRVRWPSRARSRLSPVRRFRHTAGTYSRYVVF